MGLVYDVAATVAALVATVVAFRASGKLRRLTQGQRTWTAPSPNVDRYRVVFHLGGDTRELYHGYDALQARHAFEFAPMETGMQVEFYEWGQRRGEKKA